ncbi:MAG: hypothetical protein Q9223_000490 [Gallowayella weberi]
MAAIPSLMDLAFNLRHHIVFGTLDLSLFNSYLAPHAEVVLHQQHPVSIIPSVHDSGQRNDGWEASSPTIKSEQAPTFQASSNPSPLSDSRAPFATPSSKDREPTLPTSNMLLHAGEPMEESSNLTVHASNVPQRKRRSNNDPEESGEAGPLQPTVPHTTPRKRRRATQLGGMNDDEESSQLQLTSSENSVGEGEAQHRRYEPQNLSSSTKQLHIPAVDPKLPRVKDAGAAKAVFMAKWEKRTSNYAALKKLSRYKTLIRYGKKENGPQEPFYELDKLMERTWEFGSIRVRRQFKSHLDAWMKSDDRALPCFGRPAHLDSLDSEKRELYDRLWIAIQVTRHRLAKRHINEALGRISLVKEMGEYQAIIERFGDSDPELSELSFGDQVTKLFWTVNPASPNASEARMASEELRKRFEKARPWIALQEHYESEGIAALIP